MWLLIVIHAPGLTDRVSDQSLWNKTIVAVWKKTHPVFVQHPRLLTNIINKADMFFNAKIQDWLEKKLYQH